MTPTYQDALTELYLGDAAEVLRVLPAESVHMAVTSPPYWGGIRSYRGLGAGQLGHEATPEEYVERIVGIMREVRRVLRDDGTLWLNLGDVYSGQKEGNTETIKNKLVSAENTATKPPIPELGDGQLVGIPFRVVLALQADGWRWRDTVIWHKQAPIPESVSGWSWERHRVKVVARPERENTQLVGGAGGVSRLGDGAPSHNAQWADCPGCPTCSPNDGLVLSRGQGRTTRSHEYLFLMAKGDKYYFDNEAIKEPLQESSLERVQYGWKSSHPSIGEIDVDEMGSRFAPTSGRNRRSVWSLPPEPQGDALCAGCRTYYGTRPRGKCPQCGGTDFVSHYAAFTQGLVEPCILAGTSARGCCPKCGAPWARVVDVSYIAAGGRGVNEKTLTVDAQQAGQAPGPQCMTYGRANRDTTTLGWRATCRCDAGEPAPCTVLDCFSGSGTTSITARRLGRRSIGVELSPDYLELSVHRLMAEQPGMSLGV